MAEGGRERRRFHGIGASPGIAIGRVLVLHRRQLSFERQLLPARQVAREIRRFDEAVASSLAQLRACRERLPAQSPRHDPVQILEAHEHILQDEQLVEESRRRIREERKNAEWALDETLVALRAVFGRLDDEVFRERASDVDFVGQRVLRNLLGQGAESFDSPRGEPIVIAHNLSPAETVQMLQRNARGLAIDIGSRTSHTAIVARALELPAVSGLHDISEHALSGDTAILDGDEGLVILNPTVTEIRRYRTRRDRAALRTQRLLRNRDLPAQTTDGVRVRLEANLDFLDELGAVFANGAEGVGLFRSEFLYLNRLDLPGEEEQYAAYRRLVERIHPLPTTVRTLDLGGDKFLSLHGEGATAGVGGLRAIRLCLQREDLFRTQLRALLRASVHGDLRIMVPFVTCVSEIRRVRELLDESRAELRAEGHSVSEELALGAMVETPAAVQIADLLAPYVSFFSVGTNDLIQYTMAIARDNEEVTYLYHPLHPAVLRMIRHTVAAARATGTSLSMCGEMASEPFCTLVLLGLGFERLSMAPRSVPIVKELLRRSSRAEAVELVEAIWGLATYHEVEKHVQNYMRQRFRDLF